MSFFKFVLYFFGCSLGLVVLVGLGWAFLYQLAKSMSDRQ